MQSLSVEYKTRDDEGFISGYGFASVFISNGKEFNFDRYEYQPRSSVYLPYVFIGYNFNYICLDLGVSTLLYYRDFEPVERYDRNGNVYNYHESGFYLDREKSKAFPNFYLRILPERIIHLKVRLAREEFHPVDSLFNMAIVLPWKNNIYEMHASLSTHFEQLPVTNQKISLMYSRVTGSLTLGASCSYLFFNEHGGSREDIKPFDPENLSGGLLFAINFK
jgi:hypothetical protein